MIAPPGCEPSATPGVWVTSERQMIRGMSLKQATQAVADKAAEMLARGGPAARIGLWTETGRDKVLIGIARPGQATATMLIPRADYDGMALYKMLMEEGNG